MEHKSVVGVLTFVSHAPNGTGYYFETDGGEFLDIKFSGGVADAMTVPRNEKIALCMSAISVDGYHVVCTHKPFFTVLESKRRLASSEALVKKHVGIFRQVKLDASDEKLAKAQLEVEGHAKEVEDYLKRYGRHIWDVKVRGFAMRGEQSNLPPTWAKDDVDGYIEEYGLDGFEPNYFHTHGGYHTTVCGYGSLPGNRSATYFTAGGCGVKTMIHELGHNFGLYHASTLEGDKLTTYGDSTSIMGSNREVRGFNSPNMIKLKLEDEREIKEVESTQQLLLAPIELAKHELHENEWQHARIRKDREWYSLSIRKLKESGGFYFNTSDPERLYVHKTPYDESIRYLPDLIPGKTKTLPNGIKIEYLEYDNETARVNVYYNSNDSTPDDIPMPEGFPEVVATETPSPSYNGLWYNRDFNGEGFDVRINDDAAVIYWYTYNQENTARRFYLGNCTIDGGTLDFDLSTTINGTWDDPTEYEVVAAGTGQLYFLDAEHAIFNYNTEEHGRGSVELTPVALSDNPSNGVYYQPSRNGEGVSIQFFDQLQSCVMYLYSYGPRKKVGYREYPNTEQRWYACQGSKNTDGTYDLTVYEAHDNTWMGFRDTPNVDPVGTGKLTVVDTNTLDFQYDIDADGVNGSGIFNLKRLF